MKTHVRATSIDTYRAIDKNGLRKRTTEEILMLLRAGVPLTRNEISQRTGLRINQVAGRVNELLAQGKLNEENEKVICPVTGYPAKRVYLINYYL